MFEKFNRSFIALADNFIKIANVHMVYPKKQINQLKLYHRFVWQNSLIHADKNGLQDTVVAILKHLNKSYGLGPQESKVFPSITKIRLSSNDARITNYYCNALKTNDQRQDFLKAHSDGKMDWPVGHCFEAQIQSLRNYAEVLNLDTKLIQPALSFYTKRWSWENLLMLAVKLDLGSGGVHYILGALNIKAEEIESLLQEKSNKEKVSFLPKAINAAVKEKKLRFLEALKSYKTDN